MMIIAKNIYKERKKVICTCQTQSSYKSYFKIEKSLSTINLYNKQNLTSQHQNLFNYSTIPNENPIYISK